MKFENNFVRFNSNERITERNQEEVRRVDEEDKNIEVEEVKRAGSAGQPLFRLSIDNSNLEAISSGWINSNFEEENLSEMHAQSYLVQDSDQYIKMLLNVMETNP